jgi:hypothetical protein
VMRVVESDAVPFTKARLVELIETSEEFEQWCARRADQVVGTPNSGNHCPVGRWFESLGWWFVWVDREHVSIQHNDYEEVVSPRWLKRFVHEVDLLDPRAPDDINPPSETIQITGIQALAILDHAAVFDEVPDRLSLAAL